MSPEKFCINSDNPTEEDGLGYKPYCDTIYNIIAETELETPFTIGVFGNWGSGKTSLLKMIKKKIDDRDGDEASIYPTVWFNPWRYEKEEHLIIPFFKTIDASFRRFAKDNEGNLAKTLPFLKSIANGISTVAFAIGAGLNAKLNLPFAEVGLDGDKVFDHLDKSAEDEDKAEARELHAELSSIYYDVDRFLTDLISNQTDSNNFRAFIFIDDLDRCSPDKVVEVLESIKLFLDIPGFVFILGVDKRVIEKGVLIKYHRYIESLSFLDSAKDTAANEDKDDGETKEQSAHEVNADLLPIKAEEYLEKLIQLPIYLPPVSEENLLNYIEGLCWGDNNIKACASIVKEGIHDNPRAYKRFFNTLAFYVNLAENLKYLTADGTNDKPKNMTVELLTKWSLICFSFRDLLEDIKERADRLYALQQFFLKSDKDEAKGEINKEAIGKTDIKAETTFSLDPIAKKWINNVPLKKVLVGGSDRFPDDKEEIKYYIHLSAAVVVKATESEAAARKAEKANISKEATSNIGAMITIPAGKFLYGENEDERETGAYLIGKYPVTNKDYKEFLDENPDHRKPFINQDWAKPFNWNNGGYPKDKGNHPVVLVSWNDANDYCDWLSGKEEIKDEGKKYRLPTEVEWEKAAGWDENKKIKTLYPWGNKFDKNKCNAAESGIGGTTPVTNYLDGYSPYGCYDMSGNAWEWCDNWYDEDKDSKVLRGGSWDNSADNARVTIRDWINPDNRFLSIGFRLAKTL